MPSPLFADMVLELHCNRYHQQILSYITRYETKKDSASEGLDPVGPIRLFPRFSKQYGGYVPSSQWFESVFLKFVEDIRSHYDQEMIKIEMRTDQIDHSFKVPSLMFHLQGHSICNALFTMVN
jgi:hypothetical protein